MNDLMRWECSNLVTITRNWLGSSFNKHVDLKVQPQHAEEENCCDMEIMLPRPLRLSSLVEFIFAEMEISASKIIQSIVRSPFHNLITLLIIIEAQGEV